MVTINFSDCATPVEMIAKYARSINPKNSLKEENIKLLASLVNRKFSLRFSFHTIRGLVEVFHPAPPADDKDDPGEGHRQMAFPGWQDMTPPARGTGADTLFTITVPAVEAQTTAGTPRYSAEKIKPSGVDSGDGKSTGKGVGKGVGKSVGKSSRRALGEPYATFARMREIGFRSGASPYPGYYGATAKAFVAQAEFMKDFTDDYPGSRPFVSYFPTYEMMDNEQLRTYFTWRAAFRKGEVRDIDLSYLQCYIYELLNHIGPSSAAEGMDSLIRLWGAYREKHAWLNTHMYSWIRDYYVVHHQSLTRSFTDYRLAFPVVFYEMSDDDWEKALVCPWGTLSTIEQLSSFCVAKGSFYKKSNQEVIERCVCFVMQELADWFATSGVDFKKLFYSVGTDYNYRPFSNAIVDDGTYQDVRAVSVALDKSVTVVHDGAVWRIERLSTFACSHVVGYILKMIEMYMRSYFGFRSGLTKPRFSEVENAILFYSFRPDRYDRWKTPAKKQKHWKEIALALLASDEFEQRIGTALSAYCARHHVVARDGQMTVIQPVEIDMSRLDRIRAEHRQTAAMLNTDEEPGESARPGVGRRAQAETLPGAIPEAPAGKAGVATGAAHNAAPETAADIGATTDAPLAAKPSGFPGLAATLSHRERAFLASLLARNPGPGQPDPELTAESINEKAITAINDNLVEGFDGHYSIFDEYTDDIQRILEEAIHAI